MANLTRFRLGANGARASTNTAWRDWVGIVASIGCAIHCAAMPFVIAYLPALGLSFLADESFHQWMALACFLIAMAAFIPGLKKHGNWLPISIGGGGLFLITFAAMGWAGDCCPSCEEQSACSTEATASAKSGCEHCEDCATHEASAAVQPASNRSDIRLEQEVGLLLILAPWITPVGGLLLVSAHLCNRRFGCLCGCCNDAPESDRME